MPGLVRGMARTAAVVGTATATRNAVNRRQAQKNVAAYSHAVAQTAPPPAPAVAPAPAPEEDVLTQLERLGNLLAQGIITEEEFELQKAKILAA
jgi:hypothetical protein